MSENLAIGESGASRNKVVPAALSIETCQTSQRVEAVFRYGAHYESSSRYGDPAFQIDLYQRNAMVTGFALEHVVEQFPPIDSLVCVEGVVIRVDTTVQLWVQSLASIAVLGPEHCVFNLALPHWVVDKTVVDRACALWATLPDEDRRFVNEVFIDPVILRGFLSAPGSCNHHHAHDGGCIEHSVETAEIASAMAAQSPELDRDLLVTIALVHDSGKALEYERSRSGRWSMSHCGRQIGHKISGIRLASLAMSNCPHMSPERKESLLHMLSCSYGPAWAGLRAPRIREAHVFSAIDRLSAEAGVRTARC